MKKRDSASGAEALFASAFLYALTGIMVRAVSPMWSDKAQVAARFSLVTLVLLGYYLLRKKRPTLPRSKLLLTLSGGVLSTFMILFFTAAIGKTTVANVLFVFYGANMITSFVLGSVLLKEHISRSKLLALGFAVIGLAVYSGAIVAGSLGIVFALIAGLAGGGTNVVSARLIGVDRNIVLLSQFAVVSIFTTLLLLISGDQIVRTASLELGLLTVLFALVVVVAANLTLYGFQHFDVNIGSVIMASELVFAAIMAYFLFSEVPKIHELAGGLFIMAGSVIGSGVFDKSKKPRIPIAQPD